MAAVDRIAEGWTAGAVAPHDRRDLRLLGVVRLAAQALDAPAAACWRPGVGWVCVSGVKEAALAPALALVQRVGLSGGFAVGAATPWGFIAATAILADGDAPLGALCVLDPRPRRLSLRRREVLAALGRLAGDAAPLPSAALEAEARRMRARFEAIVEGTDASVFIKRRNGELLAANAKYRQMAGRDDVVGRTDVELYGPEIGAALRARDAEIFATGRPFTGEERVVFESGEEVFYLSSKFLIFDAALDDMVLCGIATDITAQKRLQASLEISRREAEEANAAKAQFLAAVSHEIRTPMNGVIGMLALLHGTPLTDHQRAMVQVARDSAGDLLKILNDIIDFARIEAHDLTLSCAPFDPRAALRAAVEAARPRARAKGLALRLRIDRGAPERLAGDAARFRQVVSNLLGNAIKFTDAGSIQVEATPCDEGLRIAVRDTGVGVASEAQGRIFEGFTQADGSSTRRFGGLGLGLSISRRLVEAMGGRIGLESEEGRGATFWFVLPSGSGDDRGDA